MFHYFGYGSNLDLASLRAKGVAPRESFHGRLRGWRLRFNVRHWFRHEGAVGNIDRTGDPADEVLGLVHRCEDTDLAALDAMEAYGSGYDRVEVDVETANGLVRATVYVGLPGVLDHSCLPTRRYLNIMLRGAEAAGLDASYVARLRAHPVAAAREYPPFEYPAGAVPQFTRETLAQHREYTALAGAVFDMSDARADLAGLKPLFGGKDTTLFHVRRLDTSDGNETLDDVTAGRLPEAARRYLNAYLHEYAAEFRYVGRFVYD